MSEKTAVIASVLKPVDDTRMFEKLGLSIRETKQYEINIIGFAVKNPPRVPGMRFHAIYSGSRLGLARLLVPWRFLIKLLTIKPNLLIVCTPELLVPAAIYKLMWGVQLWYDVLENYQRNVRYQDAYLQVVKPLLRLAIWLTENSSRLFVDHYLLAEQCYASELNFTNGRHTVLENKYAGKALTVRPQRGKVIKMIFSGTCSRENGIVEAISLVTTLYDHGHPVKLIIAGQVPDSCMLTFIKSIAEQMEFIELIGDGALVPHATIMELAANANFGLVDHQPNPSNENCIPTKIYEYLGLRLPMILQSNDLWESVVNPYQAAVVIDFTNFDVKTLWDALQTTRFYMAIPGPEVTWEQEAEKLLEQLEI